MTSVTSRDPREVTATPLGGRTSRQDEEVRKREEGYTFLSVPTSPPPPELRSNSALQSVVNVFHIFGCMVF